MKAKYLLLISLLIYSGAIFAQQQIFWADGEDHKVYRAGIDGSGEIELYAPPTEPKASVKLHGIATEPMDVDVDFENGKVYFILNNGFIYKTDLDGSNAENVNTGIGQLFAIALDRENNKLYFSTYQNAGDIYSINTSLDGGTTAIIEDASCPIYGLAVDPNGGKLYFSVGPAPGENNLNIKQWNNNSQIMNGFISNSIYRSDLNGANIEQIVDNEYNVYGIDLDLTNNKVYWTNYPASLEEPNMNIKSYSKVMMPPLPGRIRKADLDGSNVSSVIEGLTYPFGISLDVDSYKIFYTRSPNVVASQLAVKTTSSQKEANIELGGLSSVDFDGNNNTALFGSTRPYGVQVEITVGTGNQAPVVDRNIGASLDEGGTTGIYRHMLRSVDPEGSSYIVYTIVTAPANGVLKNDGVALSVGDTFTQKDINDLKVSYEHDGSETTSDSFAFNVSDYDGNTSSAASFNFTITPVNDPPIIANIETNQLHYIPGNPPISITNTIEVTDSDNDDLTGATVEIGNYLAGSDFLNFTDTDVITHTFNSVTGILTLSGTAPLSAYQAALRSITFENTSSEDEMDSDKLITFTVNDGSALSEPEGRLISKDLPTGPAAGLNAPTNIQITYNPDGTVTVSWQDNSGNEFGFIIYRQTPTGMKVSIVTAFEGVGIVGVDEVSFVDENVTEGVAYGYTVAAYNADGIAGGDEASVVTMTHTLIPPGDLTAAEDANEYVLLNWSDNSGMEDGYIIERDDGTGFTQLATVDAGEETFTDETVVGGETYTYRVKAYAGSLESAYSNTAEHTVTDIGDWDMQVPEEFTLAQNYPNPFNPATIIRYGLPEASFVRLVVYNLLGQQVATLINRNMTAGYHEVEFNAAQLNSGIYLYKLDAGNFTQIKKMIFLK